MSIDTPLARGFLPDALVRVGIGLDDAKEAMLRLTCERAGRADGQDILELGCGWGSLTLWMAAACPRSRITGVSNSRSQKDWIEARAAELRLANITVVTADMNDFSPGGRFDRLVSVTELWAYRAGSEWLVSHDLFARRDAAASAHTHAEATWPS